MYFGRVCDHIPGDADAVVYFEPYNLTWGADGALQVPPQPAGNPRTFGITIGEQVTIVVYTDNLGNVGGSLAPVDGPVVITVGAEDANQSIHYRPPAGDDTDGAEGVYYFKLAVLRAADSNSPVHFERFLSGSNIDIWHDLPNIDNLDNSGSPGVGRVLKRIDPTTGKYELRDLAEFDPGLDYGVEVTEEADAVKLDTKGGNMNLTIEEISVTDEGTPGAQDIVFALTGSSILYFRKGLLCPSDPGDTPADLMEKTVTHLTLA